MDVGLLQQQQPTPAALPPPSSKSTTASNASWSSLGSSVSHGVGMIRAMPAHDEIIEDWYDVPADDEWYVGEREPWNWQYQWDEYPSKDYY